MGNLYRDLLYGIRMWRKTPVITLVTVFSLGLAIAANTTIFALAVAFFLQPFPFENQEELAIIETADLDQLTTENRDEVSAPDFLDLQAAVTAFSGLCAFDDEPMVLSGFDQPEEILVTAVTPGIFDVLGVEPLLGRGFRPEDGTVGNRSILVLDYGFWQRQFNGEAGVLGESLTLNGNPYTVVGIVPEEFNLFQSDVAAYRPTDLSEFPDRGFRDLLVFGRLGSGITFEQAQAEVTVFAEGLERDYPEIHRNQTLTVTRLRERIPGRTDTLLIKITIAVTLLGLLIACANIANLLLSKAGTRMKEVAIRVTLGAGRRGLFRQFLVESVLLGVGSGLFGIFLAYWAIRIFRASFPADIPRAFLPELDATVLLASVLLSVLAGILFGLAPALFTSVKDIRGALSDGGRGGTVGRKWKRIRHAFVIGEVAVALGVLTGAGLLADIFSRILDNEPGFNPDGLITFELSLLDYRYPDSESRLRFHRETIPALEEIPGVEGVAVMNRLPRTRGYSSTRFNFPGETFEDPEDRPVTGWLAVNAGYFPTMQVNLLSGRFLEGRDRSEAQPVIVVNQSFAEVHLDGKNPVGSSIEVFDKSREIVGVVANVCQERIPDEFSIDPLFYVPLEQNPLGYPTYALRSSGDRSRIAESVRSAIWSVDPDQPISPLRSFEDAYRESLGAATVFGDFLFAICAMAMFLAAMGIFGIVSHAVLRRTREIGIRISVGARESQVVGLITRQGIWLAGKGFILGAPLVFLMAQFVRAIFRFPEDLGLPLRGFSTIGVLVLVVFISSWLPARRAAKVEPIRALNAE